MNLVVFIHINKTAGSSVGTALGIPFQHFTARQFIAAQGREVWDRAFRFSFVRNPWDKVASHYHYRIETNQTGLKNSGMTFADWVKRAYGDKDPAYYNNPLMFAQQVDWLCDESGKIQYDFLGRFENLEADFRELCRLLKIEASLPHLKASQRGNYRQYYDDETCEVVAKHFAADIEVFDYRFD